MEGGIIIMHEHAIQNPNKTLIAPSPRKSHPHQGPPPFSSQHHGLEMNIIDKYYISSSLIAIQPTITFHATSYCTVCSPIHSVVSDVRSNSERCFCARFLPRTIKSQFETSEYFRERKKTGIDEGKENGEGMVDCCRSVK